MDGASEYEIVSLVITCRRGHRNQGDGLLLGSYRSASAVPLRPFLQRTTLGDIVVTRKGLRADSGALALRELPCAKRSHRTEEKGTP